MSKKLYLSEYIFESFLKQLVKVEEEKDRIIETYYSRASKERDEVMDLLNNYLKEMDEFVNSIQVSKTECNIAVLNNLPFVIIGSNVEVVDLDNHVDYQYRIIQPFHSDVSHNDVSFLSPIGKALLLKKVGDKVSVAAPGGMFHYQIKGIKLDDSLISLTCK